MGFSLGGGCTISKLQLVGDFSDFCSINMISHKKNGGEAPGSFVRRGVADKQLLTDVSAKNPYFTFRGPAIAVLLRALKNASCRDGMVRRW